MDTIEFLTQLYDNVDGDYLLTLWNKSTKNTEWFPVSDYLAIGQRAIELSATDDVYFGVGLASQSKPKGRLTANEITCLTDLWVDFDLRDNTHPDNPATVNDMMDFIESLPIQPSIVVHSGNGIHAYYLTAEPIYADEISDAKSILKGWQDYIRGRAPFKVDSTHDVSRVLRLPGTLNHKSEPAKRVEVISYADIRYNLSDFEPYRAEIESHDRVTKFKRNKSDKPANISIEQCAFLQACRDYPENLSENQWLAMITNVARCADGIEKCHELSKPYPNYSFDETEHKIIHALNDMSPTTCKYIHETLKFNQCPEGGCGVKSPCGFSLRKQPEEPPMLDEPIPSNFFDGEQIPGIQKLTDMGNAERFAEMFSHELLYCNQMGRWLMWNGKVWEPDELLQVYQYAKRCVRSMHVLAAGLSDPEQCKAISKFANASESLKNINSMISLARADLPIAVATLDSDKWKLNCQNGVIDLKTGDLLAHSASDHQTKIINADYNPQSDAPVFKKFINSVFDGNAEVTSFMQRFLGYCLTGDTREQQFVIAFGSGRNGKGTLLNLVLDILGDYACTTSPDTIYKKNTERISNDIARLAGARFVLISEAEEGKQFDEPLIKKMTGQDRMSARFLHKEFFEFMPQFKMCLMTNDKPSARASDTALWARIQLVPFLQKFEGAKQDKTLGDKLRAKSERDGILNWMVQGCLKWQHEGLNPPEEVLQATKEYQNESDKLQMWIDDCCKVGEIFGATSAQLYYSYGKWCEENGIRHMISKITFSREMVKKGFPTSRTSKGARGFSGIGLLVEDISCAN